MKSHYIQAVLEMVAYGKDIADVLSGLKKVLTEKGHAQLHGSILHNVLRTLSAQKTRVTTVSVAHEEDIHTLEKNIKEAVLELNGTTFTTNIDPTLIGGYVVTNNNMILDYSYKTQLESVYRSLTK